ncbi:MAG: RtcB family protein [Limnochordia bacterium]
MFTIFERGKNRFPIKVWLRDVGDLDEGTMQQATNLSNLPFVFKHVALMPDCHSGFGMPIGGVLPTTDVIIPNAVGVDIGCGIAFVSTNIPVELLKEGKGPKVAQRMVDEIMAAVPVGFDHHPKPQPSETLDRAGRMPLAGDPGLPSIKEGYFQIGTLGGGNHFIELQEDEHGCLGIMVHSGSRNFGYKVAGHFNKKAKELNRKEKSPVPPEYDLAYLPVEHELGQAYIKWMNLSLDFARENRAVMLSKVKEIVFKRVQKELGFKDISLKMEVNAHHNYAARERHFGEMVWVHRKGAIRAGKGELGIVPGAMGSYSYIVEGLGNEEAFSSCSHGAGRAMGRREAVRRFSVEEVEEDLVRQGVLAFGRRNRREVPEEYRMAYKNIDEVMQNSLELVRPVLRLKTLAVIKG